MGGHLPRLLVLPAVLLTGCGSDQEDPCTSMCAEAATLYGGCLASWDTQWSAAGYDDEQHFLDACATWAWELRRIEREADHRGWTDQTCRTRTSTFRDGTCADFTGTDWNAMPWDTGGPTP